MDNNITHVFDISWARLYKNIQIQCYFYKYVFSGHMTCIAIPWKNTLVSYIGYIVRTSHFNIANKKFNWCSYSRVLFKIKRIRVSKVISLCFLSLPTFSISKINLNFVAKLVSVTSLTEWYIFCVVRHTLTCSRNIKLNADTRNVFKLSVTISCVSIFSLITMCRFTMICHFIPGCYSITRRRFD